MTRKYFPFCFYVLVSVLCLGKPSLAYPSGSLSGGGATPAVTATSETNSATLDSITPLKIGDKIPDGLWDYAFPVVSPHSDQVQYLTLGDFRDKLIILDFWATWCAPCVSSLYKLDTLQQEFADDLLVFPTSYEAEDKVRKFFADKGWTLPTAFEETHLKKFFPHRIIPHQVWLKDGEVLAITNAAAASLKNISNILKGDEVKTIAKSERIDFDKSEPLLTVKNGLNEVPTLYSKGFTPYIKGVGASISRTDSTINIFNLSVSHLYRIAFADTIKHLDQYNRLVLDVPDSIKDKLAAPENLRLTGDYDNDSDVHGWMEMNHYCYAAVFPKDLASDIKYRLMKADMNNFFGHRLGIEGNIETRLIKCIVFKNSDFEKGKAIVKKADGVPIESFMYRVLYENQRGSIPIINEIEGLENLMVNEAEDYTDIEKLKSHLAEYGVDVTEELRSIPLLVISVTDNQ